MYQFSDPCQGHGNFRNHRLLRHRAGHSGRSAWGGFKGMTYTLPPFVEGRLTHRRHLRRLPAPVGSGASGRALVAFLWVFTHHTRHRSGAQGHGPGRTCSPDARDRFGPDGRGRHGAWVRARGACRRLLLPLGNIVVEAGYNVLILAIAVCIVGRTGQLDRGGPCGLYHRVCPDPHRCLPRVSFSNGGGLLAIILTLIFRPSGLFGRQKGTGGEGLDRGQRSSVARKGWTGGLRCRADSIYALMSWRELSYLSYPRLVLIVGLLVMPLRHARHVLAEGHLHRLHLRLLALSFDFLAHYVGLVSLGGHFSWVPAAISPRS